MDEAKTARRTAKRLFTISVKALQSLSDSGTPTDSQIEKGLLKLEQHYDALVSANEKVIALLPNDASETLVEEQMSYMDEINKTRNTVSSDATSLAGMLKEKAILYEKQLHREDTQRPTAPAEVKSHLERLSVPKFSGDLRDYPSWRQTFRHTMAKYCPDNEEQLQRLKEAVSPSVKNDIVHCLSVDTAFKVLDRNYGNEDELMSILLKDIKSCKLAKNGDAKSLKALAFELNNFIVRVTDLGKVHDLKSDYLFVDVLSKLSQEDQYKFKVFCRDKNKMKNISELASWLGEEAYLRVSVVDEGRQNLRGAVTASVVPHSPANYNGPSPIKPCIMKCAERHSLDTCQKFIDLNVDTRWKIIKENRCCFACLRTGHQIQNCFQKKTCSVQGCNKTHSDLLHENINFQNQNAAQNQNVLDIDNSVRPNDSKNESNDSNNVSRSVSAHINSKGCNAGYLPVLKIYVYDKNGIAHHATAMLDCGSQQTFVRKGFTDKLKLKGSHPKDLELHLAGGSKVVETSECFNLNIANCDNISDVYVLNAFSLNTVCGNVPPLDTRLFIEYPHLQNVSNKVYHNGGEVDILIGTNFPVAFRELNSSHHNTDVYAPIAKETPLGWVIMGNIQAEFDSTFVNNVTVLDKPNISKYFEIENLGVKPTKLCTCSDNELKESTFIQHVNNNITFQEDGRIEIKMPWRKGHPSFPDNRPMAIKRLLSLEKRLRSTGKVDLYNTEIQKLIDDGFCIKLQQSDVNWSDQFWLLPHQEVERPDSTSSPIRIVFDSSAAFEGVSLNDALEKGPNYLNDLFQVLIGWRENRVAYCGDIRKMFNMIAIHPHDQPFHRFLWRNCIQSDEPSVYQWTRLSFGDKSSPDLACFGIRYLATKNRDVFPLAKEALTKHIYMDDIADSKDDVCVVEKTIAEVNSVLKDGCFGIKAWFSNDPNVDKSGQESVNLLGHNWLKATDEFTLKAKNFKNITTRLTKRAIFGVIAQCWDPLGLMAPVTISLKIGMQDLWSKGYMWDEILPPDEIDEWFQRFTALNRLQEFKTSRSLKPMNAVDTPQIHGFCDGGENGFGACVFLRWKCQDGSVECRLIAAKSCVAPLKRKTIPRLELMGCITLARLVDSIKGALRTEIDREILWSDSTTALSWIRCPPRAFKPFVGVRVAEIQETHDPIIWRYVPTGLNPADALTKGIKVEQLESWHKGPDFLKFPPSEWPNREVNKRSGNDDPERKPVTISVAQVKNVLEFAKKFTNRSNDWKKIRRLTAIWLRFLHNRFGQRFKSSDTGAITPMDINNAQKSLIRIAQMSINPQSKSFVAIQPFNDAEGIWRAQGRLELAANLPFDVRHPILLPSGHPFTRRILESLHRSLGHPGYKRLVAEVRQFYWITGLRDLAKSIYFQCVLCKRRKKPLCQQQMGQLPPCRFDIDTVPFANTAVDFFGPVQVKIARKTTDKAYGCLFTCLTSRAVHAELVLNESTDHFLMALRRFACLRGWPKYIFSDNGTNFVGAQTYLRNMIESWNHEKVKSDCAEFGTNFQWEFNCPQASHMNGAVESMIKSVKMAIDGCFGFASYTQSQWVTILYEVTYLINSRPLYPASDDVLDAPPITPNMLLYGNGLIVPQPENQSIVNPRHQNNAVQQRIQLFWEQWLRHFAPTLVPRNKWFHRREDLEVGDLCILLDPQLPRALWKLALVSEIIPSTDGRIRKVIVKTKTGFYERPIHKLCLICTRAELECYSNK